MENISQDFDTNDILDYPQIFEAIKRKKLLITIITVSSFLLGALFVTTRRPTWEGQFQIVISQKTKYPKDELKNTLVSPLAQLGTKSILKTEVEILKSPSVLMPIFNDYKIKKIADGEKKMSELSYGDWLNDYFEIKLIKGSEVLNISFIDTDKDLILSTLNKVSKAYQSYSNSKRNREIELGLDYLSKQVKIFQERSLVSFREVQNYAIKHSLPMRVSLDPKTFQKDIDRVTLNKNIKYFDNILKKINILEDPLERLNYLISFSVNSRDSRLDRFIRSLDKLEREITLAEITYRPNDIKLVNLRSRQNELINLFQDSVIRYIKSELSRTQLFLDSINVPEEVLLKYKELVRKSERDNTLLLNLDKQFQATALMKAKSVDPWQLITKPTILDKPVSPRKLRILAGSLFFGIFGGIATSIFLNRISKYVYSQNFITYKYGWKILENMSNLNDQEFKSYCELIACSSLFSKESNSVIFLKTGQVDQNKYKIFTNLMKKKSSKISFKDSFDITFAAKSDLIILVGSLGNINKTDLNKINNQLSIVGKNVNYFIII